MNWNENDIKMEIDRQLSCQNFYDRISNLQFLQKQLKKKNLHCQFISSFEWRKADF